MKLILSIILFPSFVFAQPFLVCDQHPMQSDNTLYFTVSGLPSNIDATHINKEPFGSLYGFKLDMSALPKGGGPYILRAKACFNDQTYGEICSGDSDPLVISSPQVSNSQKESAFIGVKIMP